MPLKKVPNEPDDPMPMPLWDVFAQDEEISRSVPAVRAARLNRLATMLDGMADDLHGPLLHPVFGGTADKLRMIASELREVAR